MGSLDYVLWTTFGFRRKPSKVDLCPIRMNAPQMTSANWFYHGRKPHTKQYEVMANFPDKYFQYVKILDMHSRYDSKYYITRTFVKIGRGCTQEDVDLTERYCSKPAVANEPSVIRKVLVSKT